MTLPPERATTTVERELNDLATRSHGQEDPTNMRVRFGIEKPHRGYTQSKDPGSALDLVALQPIPLVRPLEPPSEYPVAALGPILAPAAQALIECVQVPAALAGNTLIAAAALAAQSHSNVQTLGGVARPLSIYALTIAGSGDRKSATDSWALVPVRHRIETLQSEYQRAYRDYEAQCEAHKLRLKEARNIDSEPDALAARLRDIPEPAPPRRPWLLCSEPTAEGLMLSLRDGQYSQGLFSDEGGGFVGS